MPSARAGSALGASTRDAGEFAHAPKSAANASKTQFPTIFERDFALLNLTPDKDTGRNLPEFAAAVDRRVRTQPNSVAARRTKRTGTARSRPKESFLRSSGAKPQGTSFIYISCAKKECLHIF